MTPEEGAVEKSSHESGPEGVGPEDCRAARLAPEIPPAPTVLEVRDLDVSYGPVRAVDGVTLEIREGEIFGLLGPNGAGKTTTLSAIEGLLKPEAGSVLIQGIDIQKDPLAAKAQMGVQLQFFQRLRVAPISTWEIMASRLIVQVVAMLGMAVIVLVVAVIGLSLHLSAGAGFSPSL